MTTLHFLRTWLKKVVPHRDLEQVDAWKSSYVSVRNFYQLLICKRDWYTREFSVRIILTETWIYFTNSIILNGMSEWRGSHDTDLSETNTSEWLSNITSSPLLSLWRFTERPKRWKNLRIFLWWIMISWKRFGTTNWCSINDDAQ